MMLYNLISVLFSFMDSPVEWQEKKQQEQEMIPGTDVWFLGNSAFASSFWDASLTQVNSISVVKL